MGICGGGGQIAPHVAHWLMISAGNHVVYVYSVRKALQRDGGADKTTGFEDDKNSRHAFEIAAQREVML